MTNNIIGHSMGVAGEYRAKLYGPDGRLKLDTGWKPNMILDQGLYNLTLPASFIFETMSIGDSAVALDVTQTGLQGSILADVGGVANSPGWNTLAPDYKRTTGQLHTFAPGAGTGTIQEFVVWRGTGAGGNANDDASIRVLLDAPIVKGAQDQLVIEHRLHVYPHVADVVGVIDISGTDYDYVLRYFRLARGITDKHGSNLVYGDGALLPLSGGVLGTVESDGPTGTPTGAWPHQMGRSSRTQGGSAPNYYLDDKYTGTVDQVNGDISVVYMPMNYYGIGMQCSLGKVSDGTPLTKEDTHEFTLTYRQTYNRH